MQSTKKLGENVRVLYLLPPTLPLDGATKQHLHPSSCLAPLPHIPKLQRLSQMRPELCRRVSMRRHLRRQYPSMLDLRRKRSVMFQGIRHSHKPVPLWLLGLLLAMNFLGLALIKRAYHHVPQAHALDISRKRDVRFQLLCCLIRLLVLRKHRFRLAKRPCQHLKWHVWSLSIPKDTGHLVLMYMVHLLSKHRAHCHRRSSPTYSISPSLRLCPQDPIPANPVSQSLPAPQHNHCRSRSKIFLPSDTIISARGHIIRYLASRWACHNHRQFYHHLRRPSSLRQLRLNPRLLGKCQLSGQIS